MLEEDGKLVGRKQCRDSTVGWGPRPRTANANAPPTISMLVDAGGGGGH